MSNGKVFLIGAGPDWAALATLADAARDTELGSPALVVIGRVVGLARSIGQVEQLHRVA